MFTVPGLPTSMSRPVIIQLSNRSRAKERVASTRSLERSPNWRVHAVQTLLAIDRTSALVRLYGEASVEVSEICSSTSARSQCFPSGKVIGLGIWQRAFCEVAEKELELVTRMVNCSLDYLVASLPMAGKPVWAARTAPATRPTATPPTMQRTNFMATGPGASRRG